MINIYTDGASQGNPGPAGAGIFMKKGGTLERYAVPLGIMSNHEAEFHACIIALEKLQERDERIVSLRSDSMLLVDAVEKEYVKQRIYKPLLERILVLSESFDHCFIKWIPGKENKEADHLARQAIHKNM